MFLNTNPKILNEEYYGTNNELKKMENALKNIRDKINTKGSLIDIEATEEYQVLKKGICEVFGFKDIILDCGLYHDFGIFTIPVSSTLTYIFTSDSAGKSITKNKYGICYTKDANMIAYLRLDMSVMIDNHCDINEKEMLAIILHEIGHNFFATNKKNAFLIMVNMYRALLLNIVLNINNPQMVLATLQNVIPITFGNKITYGWVAKFYELWNNLTKGNIIRKILITLTQFLKSGVREVSGLANYCFVMLALFSLPVVWIHQFLRLGIASLFNLLTFGWIDTIYVGYDNEKFSDNFATTYGYGPELATGLDKLTSFAQYNMASTSLKSLMEKDSSGILQTVISVVCLPSAIVTHALLDCHPNTEQRVLGQTKMLKSELQRNKKLSPAVKKQLLEDIKKMEKIEHEYFYANETKDNPFQKSRKQSSQGTMSYGGDYREVIRGEDKEDLSKEWEQFEIAAKNYKEGKR